MKRRTLLVWLTFGHFANDWPVSSLWLTIPAAGITMGLTPTEVGLLFTIINAGGALAYIPAGILADVVSNRRCLLLATFWWVAAGFGLAAIAETYWTLAILLVLAGMGNASWHPIAAGVLSRENSDGRAHALGIHAMGGSVAEMLAPLAVGALLVHVDWRVALSISALPPLVFGIIFVRAAQAVPLVSRRVIRRQEVLDFVVRWSEGSSLRIVIMICLYNMAFMGLLSMIPLYLAAAHGFTAAEIGLTFSGVLFAGAVLQPFVGRLSDLAGRKPLLVFCNASAGIASLLLMTQLPIPIMLVGLAIAIASLDTMRAVALAATIDVTGEQEGTTVGLAFVLMEGIGALGALLFGIAAGVSWPYMFGLSAVLALASAVMAKSIDFRPWQAGRLGDHIHER